MYKMKRIVFKALNGLAPNYISNMLQYKPQSCHALRSDDSKLLVEPRSHSITYGDRNCVIAAPKLWNKRPLDMRKCDDIVAFKKHLKPTLL